MRYVDEFRDAERVQSLARAISRETTRPWIIMEICGGQTHAIVRHGIDELLPEEITLVHGPGCPVCVTAEETLAQAFTIATRPNVLFCSFGDMLRVPSGRCDLLSLRAQGANIRTVYSPLDAVRLAQNNPQSEVVFFAVGFETTAPATALAVLQAEQLKLKNFSVLVAHVLVPPAMRAILQAPACRIQGFLAAGHVCTVMGFDEYHEMARCFQVPLVITGFEPVDLLDGIYRCVKQLEAGSAAVDNSYSRCVQPEGNLSAREWLQQVFTVVDRRWRGLGMIPASGWGLSERFREWDALQRWPDLDAEKHAETAELEPAAGDCLSGLILQGLRKPHECPEFGLRCTPDQPLGATMVSAEGACAAYYHYRRTQPAPLSQNEEGRS
ncbi:MAG: hydrogenase formation protein HypD [Planctomycetota bacterium]